MIPRGHESREWITLNEEYGVSYRKIGYDVEVRLKGSNVTLSGFSNIQIGLLPKNYRSNILLQVPTYTAMGASSAINLQIRADGWVYLFNWQKEITLQDLSGFIKYTV